jgi:hypothetical protein
MKCGDYLSARETGGPLGRFFADRHAAGCPQCRALGEKLDAVKNRLAESPRLSARARWLWERSAEERKRPAALIFRPQVALAAVAVLLAVVVVIVVLPNLSRPEKIKAIAPSTQQVVVEVAVEHPITVQSIDASVELDRLTTEAEELDARIASLRKKAEAADARREVASALVRFEHW